jgi:hypothetical protein
MNDPITIRHLDDATADWVEDQAARRGLDKETILLELIHRGLDLEQKKTEFPKFRDLDLLAGTWSEEEADEFDRAIASLRTIDEDFWR